MARRDATRSPRFRQDLVAEPIDDGGARFIDVMDPDSGNMFRFYEVEYSLACAMDGERDVAGIVQWAQEELGLTPTPAEVRTVIATLGDLGFIDGIDGGVVRRIAAARTPSSREASSSASARTRFRATRGRRARRSGRGRGPRRQRHAGGAAPHPRCAGCVVAGTTCAGRRHPTRHAGHRATSRLASPSPRSRYRRGPDVSLDLSDQMTVARPTSRKRSARRRS